MAQVMANPQQQNAIMRDAFLRTALRCSQTLPVQTFSAGQTMQFELNNSGVLRYLKVAFDGTLTNAIGTGTLGVSANGPYVLFPTVEFVDYLGTKRVNAGAFMLQNRVNLNKFGYDPSFTPVDTGVSTDFYKYTAVDSAQPLKFSFIVPIMYDENDPRGGIILTVPNGKCYLKVTPLATLGGATDDFLVKLTGNAAVTSLTGTVTVTQYYFNPQTVKMGGRDVLPLPMLDFQQIHEMIETKSTSNLAAGLEKSFSLPTGRVYHVIMHHFFNGSGGPDTTDIDRIAFLYDGNTPTLDENLAAYLTRIRDIYGRDLPKGLFVHDFRKRPWDASLWGQLQTLMRVKTGATVNTGAYVATMTDTLYTSTANLSGVQQ